MVVLHASCLGSVNHTPKRQGGCERFSAVRAVGGLPLLRSARVPKDVQRNGERNLCVLSKSPKDDNLPEDDKAAELSARDLQMIASLNARVTEIESRSQIDKLMEAVQNEGLSRRVLVGLLLTASVSGAVIAQSNGSGNKLPLSYYLAELIATEEVLKQAEIFAQQKDWIQYNSIRRRIVEGNTKSNMQGAVAAAKLQGTEKYGAQQAAADFFELVNQMDYSSYLDSFTRNNAETEYLRDQQERNRQEFSLNAARAASLKLQELLRFMPSAELRYARAGGANGSLGSTATVSSPDSL